MAILGPFDPRPKAEGWSIKSGVGGNEVSDRHARSLEWFRCSHGLWGKLITSWKNLQQDPEVLEPFWTTFKQRLFYLETIPKIFRNLYTTSSMLAVWVLQISPTIFRQRETTPTFSKNPNSFKNSSDRDIQILSLNIDKSSPKFLNNHRVNSHPQAVKIWKL